MRSLLLAYVLEERVRDRIVAGRAAVDIVGVSLFSCLTSCEQPVDGSDACLKPQARPDHDACPIGDSDPKLVQAILEPQPVAILNLSDLPHELGRATGERRAICAYTLAASTSPATL